MKFSRGAACSWVRVFRINPEFRNMRLTFHISLKMLKYTDFDSFSDIFSCYLKTILTI